MPLQEDNKERYVFFSFPHIAVDAHGEVGNISRPGRPGASSACGALKGALAELHANGIKANESQAGSESGNFNIFNKSAVADLKVPTGTPCFVFDLIDLTDRVDIQSLSSKQASACRTGNRPTCGSCLELTGFQSLCYSG